ncbi:hypothetical protein ACFTWS_21500 [Streptomyces sp. NPDC057027]|uniref:hypothetical protein n=1 Tax=Streptomyces sp. NPDC057027 TaxID=3346004 RepID=UPI003633A900
MTGTPTTTAPATSEPDSAALGSAAPDPAEEGTSAASAPKKTVRKSSSDDAPGPTAMMVALFGWEAVSDGHAVWIRIVAALFTLLGVLDLAGVAVRRWRARR